VAPFEAQCLSTIDIIHAATIPAGQAAFHPVAADRHSM
jgi:hypothetical protein